MKSFAILPKYLGQQTNAGHGHGNIPYQYFPLIGLDSTRLHGRMSLSYGAENLLNDLEMVDFQVALASHAFQFSPPENTKKLQSISILKRQVLMRCLRRNASTH